MAEERFENHQESRLRPVIWFRGIIGFSTSIGGAGAIINGFLVASKGDMYPFEGLVWIIFGAIALLVFGLPSLFVFKALTRNPARGIQRAIIHDAVIAISTIIVLAICNWSFYVAGSRDLEGILYYTLGTSAVALPFLVEGVWLRRVHRARENAWRDFGIFIAVAVLLGFILPVVFHRWP